MNISQALNVSDIDLKEATYLMAKCIGFDRIFQISNPDHELDEKQLKFFIEICKRRKGGFPIPYIVGSKEFYGENFIVNDSVLIPRPETELIVDLIVEKIPLDKKINILDLGTGCGNLAIILSNLFPFSNVLAVDLDDNALNLAKDNYKKISKYKNISFVLSDWFSNIAIHKKFDIIVSNPPYVSSSDYNFHYQELRFEPKISLIGGRDGTDAIIKIIKQAKNFLKKQGILLIENGYDQPELCKNLLHDNKYKNLIQEKDLSGIVRISGGII